MFIPVSLPEQALQTVHSVWKSTWSAGNIWELNTATCTGTSQASCRHKWLRTSLCDVGTVPGLAVRVLSNSHWSQWDFSHKFSKRIYHQLGCYFYCTKKSQLSNGANSMPKILTLYLNLLLGLVKVKVGYLERTVAVWSSVFLRKNMNDNL